MKRAAEVGVDEESGEFLFDDEERCSVSCAFYEYGSRVEERISMWGDLG